MSAKVSAILSKVERANEHIGNFEREFVSFKESNPYRFNAKRDPNTRELVYYIENTVITPHRFALIAGDAIQNLRSALDHLVWRLVEANSGTPTRNNEFPISEDAKNYKANSPRKVKGMRPEAKEAIDAIEPYKGGRGEELWVLHRLNITDKHRLLVTVGAALSGMNIGIHLEGKVEQHFGRKSPPMPPIIGLIQDSKNPGKPIFPLEAGTILFTDAPDSELNKNMQFVIQVAFCESGVAEGKPVVETLHGTANLIQNIISDFSSFL